MGSWEWGVLGRWNQTEIELGIKELKECVGQADQDGEEQTRRS